MAYELGGVVVFHFDGVVIEGEDPTDATHLVESMSPYELLDYATDESSVQVEHRKTVL